MNGIVFLPDRNRQERKDYSGAFRPEATRLAKLHGLAAAQVIEVPIRLGAQGQRAWVVNALRTAGALGGPLDLVAFLCHGERRWLQLGVPSLDEVPELAQAIAAASSPAVRVVLYACHTAEGEPGEGGAGGEGGFANRLRDELVQAGAANCWVDAHERAGHTTRNSYVRRFEAGRTGGLWLVEPKGPQWARWDARLHDEADPLRFHYPLLTRDELAAELAG